MFSQSTLHTLDDFGRDLRVGIWIPKSFTSFQLLLDFIKQQEVFQTGDTEIFTNNDDNLISDEAYRTLCKLYNVLILTTNFPYLTHVDVSFSKKTTDIDFREDKYIDISPLRFFSPDSSPKSDLFEDTRDTQCPMSIASVFIVLGKEDLRSKSVEFIKIYVSEIIESFKLLQTRIKFILVMNGTRDLALGSPGKISEQLNGSQDDPASFKISFVNELSSYLLVYHNVDTIETDEYGDLANIIAQASKSIRHSYTKRRYSKFKSKQGQAIRDDEEILNRTWMSQLVQMPNVGKSEAEAIVEKYKRPSEVIESILESREEFLNRVRSTSVEGKRKKTLGRSISHRLTTLYSYTLLPDELL